MQYFFKLMQLYSSTINAKDYFVIVRTPVSFLVKASEFDVVSSEINMLWEKRIEMFRETLTSPYLKICETGEVELCSNFYVLFFKYGLLFLFAIHVYGIIIFIFSLNVVYLFDQFHILLGTGPTALFIGLCLMGAHDENMRRHKRIVKYLEDRKNGNILPLEEY